MMKATDSFLKLGYLIEDSAVSSALLLQALRSALYCLILVVSVGAYLFQASFINWSFLFPFYSFLLIGFSLHLLWVSLADRIKKHANIYFIGFVADALILSALIHFSGINQSLFLFLHLVNILIAGICYGASGAVLIAFVTSISFATAAIFQPEMQPLQMIFMLALNNVAFFAVAYLSGYLSEQLQTVGAALSKTGLSLQEQQEFNQALLGNLPVGLISFDSKGSILQMNERLQGILGEGEVIGKLTDILPQSYLQRTTPHREDLTYVRQDGSKRILGTSLTSFHSALLDGEVRLALIEDLTQIRALEYAAKQNEKLAAIGGLAAGIAHEIRNPLAGISGSVELLSQTTQNDDDKKLMKIILREIDRLNNLIGEFLEYSRPESPPDQQVDLGLILMDVLENIKLNKTLRNDVELDIRVASHVMILGKKDKLKQAFLNIILNAFQAMQDVPVARFAMSLQAEGEKAILKLKDTGCGMSEETKKRMFEPFHTTKPKGTGLGLAVTHKILDGHRAQLFVETEVGKGTEFVLEFPLVQNRTS